MEGKTVIMTTLLLSLVLGNIQVEAIVLQTCCPPTPPGAKIFYDKCIFAGGSEEFCQSLTGCINIPFTEECPLWNHDIIENTGDNAVKYCKLGCASSVCGAITTLQNSDASEVVNGVIEKCTKACSALCTKGSITAVKTA